MSDPYQKLDDARFFLDNSNGSDPNLYKACEIMLDVIAELKARIP